METHHVRTCSHLENEWDRMDVLNEEMSLEDVSSAWVLPTHHANGNLVCSDCFLEELGKQAFRAYLQYGSPSIVLCIACDSDQPCNIIPGPDDNTEGYECTECGCAFA